MTGERPAGISWQRILSTLASHRLRGLYAALVLGQQPEMTAKERQKLLASGLVMDDDAGALAIAPDAFKAALAAARTPEPTGPERFLAGGLVVLPHRAADRLELLGYLRDRVSVPGETMTEKELNAKLAAFTADVPMLRRAMVDYGFLAREPDGSAYRQTAAG